MGKRYQESEESNNGKITQPKIVAIRDMSVSDMLEIEALIEGRIEA